MQEFPFVESGDAALAAITFVDRLGRALVSKGVLTEEERRRVIADTITYLAGSNNPQGKAAALALAKIYGVAPKSPHSN